MELNNFPSMLHAPGQLIHELLIGKYMFAAGSAIPHTAKKSPL